MKEKVRGGGVERGAGAVLKARYRRKGPALRGPTQLPTFLSTANKPLCIALQPKAVVRNLNCVQMSSRRF